MLLVNGKNKKIKQNKRIQIKKSAKTLKLTSYTIVLKINCKFTLISRLIPLIRSEKGMNKMLLKK